MNKRYSPKEFEEKIYKEWEESGCFTPEISDKDPFTIILPPPNANDPLHIGHALFAVEDILCRWHRMMGDPTLFLPGTDHAGIETQFVFEKRLNEEGKTRFDYDRDTLYEKINDYVQKNRGIAKSQLKKLGLSLDWTRERFTLEPEILETVKETFRELHDDDLVYRGERMLSYCPQCGTSFSSLEVDYVERKDPLYYMEYGPLEVATVRPETRFGDTAIAVHPDDERYQELIGTEFTYDSLIGPREMRVIADEAVEPEFGTGAVKVTPAHDPNDYEMAQRHDLKIIQVIDKDGVMNENAGRFEGMTAEEARKEVVKGIEEKGEMIKIDEKYLHRVGTCYKCGHLIEPTLMPQWFVKIEPLAEKAIEVVDSGELEIFPERFKKTYLQWMNKIHDWNISRQIVWGPRIPAWYCLDCNPEIRLNFIKDDEVITGRYDELDYSFENIKKGLQRLTAPKDASYILEESDKCSECGGDHILQETDTFDTWFSSGQWPFTTLNYPDGDDFNYFYPTTVLDTMWDILFFWVARMVMLGIYKTGEIPFKVAHMHSRVTDEKGKKMSKSKGNVVNPIEVIDEHGADVLRMSLVFGSSPGGDVALGDDKLKAMRNFCNKIWNASRFIDIMIDRNEIDWDQELEEEIMNKFNETTREVNRHLENYRFGLALETIYEFFWHIFCDEYIESAKGSVEEALPTLLTVLVGSLKLLHPFAPFITEAIYGMFREKIGGKLFKSKHLMLSQWPEG